MRLPNLNLRRGDFCGTNIVLLTFGSRRGSLALGDMESGITTCRAESKFIVIETDLDKCNKYVVSYKNECILKIIIFTI